MCHRVRGAKRYCQRALPLPEGDHAVHCHEIQRLICVVVQEISEVDPVLRFIRPLFTMGQAAGRASLLKEANILNMKQREIMTEFRNGIVNLLVATSVLEEGIDIPECNLIVRFDRCKTYCDYVQAKGKHYRKTFVNFTELSLKLQAEQEPRRRSTS